MVKHFTTEVNAHEYQTHLNYYATVYPVALTHTTIKLRTILFKYNKLLTKLFVFASASKDGILVVTNEDNYLY